jgi:hypothetical protein
VQSTEVQFTNRSRSNLGEVNISEQPYEKPHLGADSVNPILYPQAQVEARREMGEHVPVLRANRRNGRGQDGVGLRVSKTDI